MVDTNPTTQVLRKFGVSFCLILLALTLLILWRHHSLNIVSLAASGLFLASAFLLPQILKPLYIGWMALAFGLGWVNTRIILGIVFFLVFTPIGIFLRLTGKDILDEKIEKARESYWIRREPKTFEKHRYEQLF